MNLCEFKGPTNSTTEVGKLLELKMVGYTNTSCVISLFKVDICPLIHIKYLSIGHSSHIPECKLAIYRSSYPH